MIYGRGFPREVQFGSGLIDLGDDKNITALRWDADTPLGTAVEIRSRSGNSLDLNVAYHDKNGKSVTAARYQKLIPSFRGRIDTTFSPGADWSPWSNIYSASGAAFLSPSPRRYLELDLRLTSDDLDVEVALDHITVEFSPPLAEGLFGKIFPAQVEPGIEHEFSYFLQARSAPHGFDRIALEAPSALRFAAAVFVPATRFAAFLEDGEIRQRVDPGNASDRVASDSDVVRFSVGGDLLKNLVLNTSVVMPNGDGINDGLRLSVHVVNVLAPCVCAFTICPAALPTSAAAKPALESSCWSGTGETTPVNA